MMLKVMEELRLSKFRL